ncbi:MAG: metallophosphoesterase, partial [Ancrocorticia populi]
MTTSTLGRWAAGTLMAGASVAIWGLTEAHAYTVRHRTVLVDRNRMPQESERSDRLRVLHLSDIHLMPYQHKKMRWLASLASTQPDLVVFTGDQVASRESLPLLMEALTPLAGTPGAFVYGSNDY